MNLSRIAVALVFVLRPAASAAAGEGGGQCGGGSIATVGGGDQGGGILASLSDGSTGSQCGGVAQVGGDHGGPKTLDGGSGAGCGGGVATFDKGRNSGDYRVDAARGGSGLGCGDRAS